MSQLYSVEIKYLYVVTVSCLSIFFLLRGLFIIRLEKRRRVKKAQKAEFNDPVLSAGDNDEESETLISRRRAVQSIESRFEFIRRF